MSERELTSLEIRNLLLEILSYEGEDLDGGNNFKKYLYQGNQADLIRLLEVFTIKKGLKTKIIEIRPSAWGADGENLYVGMNTNFTRNELLKIYEEFYYLTINQVIAPGGAESYGRQLPYFHVTEYGLECLKCLDILPYDSDGYLSKLKSIPNIHEWILFHMQEALTCFNTNCINSAMINIGLCGEIIIEELISSFSNFLSIKKSALKSKFDNDIEKEWRISLKYNIFIDTLEKFQKKIVDPTLNSLVKCFDTSSASIFATYTRLTRNSLAHPSGLIMDRTEVLLFFVSFHKYCGLQYNIINYFKVTS